MVRRSTDHHLNEMDDPENGGVSNAAIRLFDWVRDPSILQYSLVISNVNKNGNGGYYRNGVAKTLVEKIDVAAKWIEMSNDSERSGFII